MHFGCDILVKQLWKAIGAIPFKHLNTSRTQVLFLVSFTLGNCTEVFRPLATFSTRFWMSSNFCLFDVGKLIKHCYNTALITRVRSSFSGCSVVYYLLQYIPVHSLPGDELVEVTCATGVLRRNCQRNLTHPSLTQIVVTSLYSLHYRSISRKWRRMFLFAFVRQIIDQYCEEMRPWRAAWYNGHYNICLI